MSHKCSAVTLVLACFAAGTPYEGGVFRMKLMLGEDFPTAPPKGESRGLGLRRPVLIGSHDPAAKWLPQCCPHCTT